MATEAETVVSGVEFLTIIAIIAAPIVAVQVQKVLEKIREARGRKMRVFKTLMATRAAALSPDHVQALNMIDLEFNDDDSSKVTLAWKTYLDHLCSFPKDNESAQVVWANNKNELFANLLMEMGKVLNYTFDIVHIKKGIYMPEAHAQIEDENLLIRKGLIDLLYGKSCMKMDVQSLPFNEEEVDKQRVLKQALQNLLDGKRELPISIKNDNHKSTSEDNN